MSSTERAPGSALRPERMLRVPAELLPTSPSERHASLRDYFCDIDADAEQANGCWDLSLSWPSSLDRHVDPQLLKGLEWWGGGITPATMAFARRRQGPILTSLYDTWTLQSWCEWLSRSTPEESEGLIILHVDDHRDLAAPRLFIENNGLVDAITGDLVNLAEPDSVQRAILSGAIGMGSFLTPFVHKCPKAQVRQLCQPPKTTRTQDYKIELKAQIDTLLRPGALRPAVELIPHGRQLGIGCYRATSSLNDWLEATGVGAILLHIDMDYFNNRYDGDTDWHKNQSPHNPPIGDILNRIDGLILALRDFGVGGRIRDVVISYSPGFFPAEFWRDADARIRAGLDSLL
ncbi:hypothetical protein [Bradyrhizobium elkanii]